MGMCNAPLRVHATHPQSSWQSTSASETVLLLLLHSDKQPQHNRSMQTGGEALNEARQEESSTLSVSGFSRVDPPGESMFSLPFDSWTSAIRIVSRSVQHLVAPWNLIEMSNIGTYDVMSAASAWCITYP